MYDVWLMVIDILLGQLSKGFNLSASNTVIVIRKLSKASECRAVLLPDIMEVLIDASLDDCLHSWMSLSKT